MREVVAAAGAGDGAARLALAVYVHRLRGRDRGDGRRDRRPGRARVHRRGGRGLGARCARPPPRDSAFLGVASGRASATPGRGRTARSERRRRERAHAGRARPRGHRSSRAALGPFSRRPPDPRPPAARAVAWWRCPTTASPPSRSRGAARAQPARGGSQPQPELANADRTDPHPPLPRDKRGWQVAPSPDGRGMPEHADTPPPPHRTRGFLWFVIALLAFNWLLVLVFGMPAERRKAGDGAVQPLLPRTGEGRARQIDQHQGQHRRGQLHGQAPLPAERREGDADEAVRDRGADLLERQPAVGPAAGKARPDQRRIDLLENLAAGRAAARLRPHAADHRAVRADRQTRRAGERGDGSARRLRPQPRAQGRPRNDPRDLRRRGRDRRGQGGAVGDRRLPAKPRALRAPRRAHAPRGAAVRGARAPARRCSRGPSRARRTPPSSRSPPRSSSRRSSASARRACATCSPRPRRRRRRSSSSTSSTRSGAPARARCR